jgi:hypothetical protein
MKTTSFSPKVIRVNGVIQIGKVMLIQLAIWQDTHTYCLMELCHGKTNVNLLLHSLAPRLNIC